MNYGAFGLVEVVGSSNAILVLHGRRNVASTRLFF